MSQFPSAVRLRIWLGLIVTIAITVFLSKLMESWIAGIIVVVPVGLFLTVRWAKSAMNGK